MEALFNCRIDTSNLIAAQSIFNRHSRHDPAHNINRTALFVVLDAQRTTHFTTVSKIDAQLQVTTTPVLVTRGPRTGLPLKSGKTTSTTTFGSVAARIILARLNPNSSYNLMTDRKWLLNKDTFSPGMGKAGFERKVEQKAVQMARARHSSIKFFLSSWNPVIRDLIAALGSKRIPGGATGDRDIDSAISGAEPARGGQLTTQCVVENRIGMSGRFPNLDLQRNIYAHQHLKPRLQAAIDKEFTSKMLEAERRGWLRDRPELARLGFEVKV